MDESGKAEKKAGGGRVHRRTAGVREKEEVRGKVRRCGKNKWSASAGNLGLVRATAPNRQAPALVGQFRPEAFSGAHHSVGRTTQLAQCFVL